MPIQRRRSAPEPEPDESSVGIDLAKLSAYRESRAARLIAARIDETIAQVTRQLEVAPSWDDARYLQGVLKGMRAAQAIPQVLIDEAKKKTERTK